MNSTSTSTSASSNKAVSFNDGAADNEVIQYADAFLVLSQEYPEDCRFTMNANGATMHFVDFNCSTFFRTFVNNNDPVAYMRWLDYIQRNHNTDVEHLRLSLCTDCGWVLRNYGHPTGESWDCKISKSISKETAEKVFQLLNTSSRLSVRRTESNVVAEYNS